MKYFFVSLLSIAILSVSGVRAQLSINGEYRIRTTMNHGYKIPVLENSKAVFSVDQRTRLNLNYKTEKYNTALMLQDARLWGDNDLYNKTGVLGNSSSFGVAQAWVELLLTENSSLKIGRQFWNYNDMRIFSSRNWWNSGLSYDGILYQYKNNNKRLKLDIGASFNNMGDLTGAVNNAEWNSELLKTMNFVNIYKDFSDKLNMALMLSLSGKTENNNDKIFATATHGAIVNYNKDAVTGDGIFANTSFYYQHGTDMIVGTNDKQKSISAYLADVNIGVRSLSGKLEIATGAEILSGHDYTNKDTDYNNTRHTFDMQYSARFPLYGGNMNYFLLQESYAVGTKSGGIITSNIKMRIKPNSNNIFEAAAYLPTLTTKVLAHKQIDPVTNKPTGIDTDSNGNPIYWKGTLGTNIDLGYTHIFSKQVVLKTGISYAVISDIKNQMIYGYSNVENKILHDMGNSFFGWMMLIVKPDFLETKKN